MPRQKRAEWKPQVTPEEAGLGAGPQRAGKKHLGPVSKSRPERLPAVGLQRHLVVKVQRRVSSTCVPHSRPRPSWPPAQPAGLPGHLRHQPPGIPPVLSLQINLPHPSGTPDPVHPGSLSKLLQLQRSLPAQSPDAHWVSPSYSWGPKLWGQIDVALNTGGSTYQLCDLSKLFDLSEP